MKTAARDSVKTMPDTKRYRRTTIKEASQAYQLSLKCKRTTIQNLKILEREVGSTALANITTEFLNDYVTHMCATNSQYGRPYTKATIAKQIQALRGLVRFQAESLRVEPPLSAITISVLGDGWDNERTRLLEPHEEDALRTEFKNCVNDEHWPLLMTIALETGARQAEIVMAEQKEFDLNEKVWIIPAAHTKVKKTRQVPLSKVAHAAAKKLIKLLDEENERLLAADPKAKRLTRVFWPFSTPSSVSSGFRKLTRKLRIDDLHFHDLRHTAITRMVLTKRKLSVYEIMKIVGHTTLKMLDRYANLRGGDLVDRME
ncbi:site-specific integrase [Rhodoferax aquaticus]|nr:site-specific integrase [Rhodoferax aquaticus]